MANMRSGKIEKLLAREVLDSRGYPTVEVEIIMVHPKGHQILARAITPSGASTGEGEALELRDGATERFLGKGVLQAIRNISEKIAPVIVGRDYARQTLLDDQLRELDGTDNKSHLGANAILPVSMAFAKAHAMLNDVPLYTHLAQIFESQGRTLPVPLMNILNGGQHADNELDVQEFMIAPVHFDSFREALRAGAEVFHCLKKILNKKGLITSVGDEGGFAPNFPGNKPHEQAITAILQAISDAGYKAGKDIFIALDAASSEFAEARSEGKEYLYRFEGQELDSGKMISIYQRWMETFPIVSIEDGLAEHDWEGWKSLTSDLGSRCQLVGDDLFVTNPAFLKKGIEQGAGNSILIKLNQIGTVTETLEAMRLARESKFSAIASHRSGETEDVFIADLAVGTECGQIKTGSASRTDRTAKYNQLLRIEELLGSRAKFAGLSAIRRG